MLIFKLNFIVLSKCYGSGCYPEPAMRCEQLHLTDWNDTNARVIIKNMKKQNKENKNEIIVFQNKSGAIEFKGDFEKETLWATQMQIADAFDVNIRTVNEHIKNIYKTEELSEKPTIRKFRIVQKEGKREVEREVQRYNLDMLLSAGYHVNSKKSYALFFTEEKV